jgi:hypothetical protein
MMPEELDTDMAPFIALKNADPLLRDILKAVDTSGDGQIQYNGEADFWDLSPTCLSYTNRKTYTGLGSKIST